MTSEWINECKIWQVNEWMNENMTSEWMNGWQYDMWMNEWMKIWQVNEWMYANMRGEWIMKYERGWMDGWTTTGMNKLLI